MSLSDLLRDNLDHKWSSFLRGGRLYISHRNSITYWYFILDVSVLYDSKGYILTSSPNNWKSTTYEHFHRKHVALEFLWTRMGIIKWILFYNNVIATWCFIYWLSLFSINLNAVQNASVLQKKFDVTVKFLFFKFVIHFVSDRDAESSYRLTISESYATLLLNVNFVNWQLNATMDRFFIQQQLVKWSPSVTSDLYHQTTCINYSIESTIKNNNNLNNRNCSSWIRTSTTIDNK